MKSKVKNLKKLRKMKVEFQKLLSLQKFFKIKQKTSNIIILRLEKPSSLLLQNIHYSWLKYIHVKTVNNFPVYLDKNVKPTKNNVPCYGSIECHSTESIKEITIEPNDNMFCPQNTLDLKLKITLPQTEIMQCFIQWQRYRKYWWSSVSINDYSLFYKYIACFYKFPNFPSKIRFTGRE